MKTNACVWIEVFYSNCVKKKKIRETLSKHVSNSKIPVSKTPISKIPVVLNMCSYTIFEIPQFAFLFAPCWDKICGTQHLELFCRQPSPSSRLWCGQTVSNLCVTSSRKISNSTSISSLSVVTPGNDQ